MTLLIDAGPLVAAADPNEPRRQAVLAALADAESLIIPAPTTVEIDYLLGRRFGHAARRAFLADLASGRFTPHPQTVSQGDWELRVLAPARRQLARFPMSVSAAVIETLHAIATIPHRVGTPLRFELEGRWSARRGPYRIVYAVDDTTRTVEVLAIAHRRDVYCPR